MTPAPTPVGFPGKILMIGCGSIGQGVLPLLLRHIAIPPERIAIVTAAQRGRTVADEYGVRFIRHTLVEKNFRQILEPLLDPGDLLLNLSVDVSSLALVALARDMGALYLDTCIEPWAGGYTDPALTPAQRSNYALREAMLAMKRAHPGGPTAVMVHGANPGLVSHFVKQALLDIADATGQPAAEAPARRADWAALGHRLGVRVIHVAERDTQVTPQRKAPGEFVNTWSIDGFVGEGCQPAELGWGSHERQLPPDGHAHDQGCRAAIWLARPGASTKVRSWTPLEGPYQGFLITHNEAISLADYLTVGEAARPQYRPTVHYAYHPCDDAVLSMHELAGKAWVQQRRQRLLMHEISSGIDELGVLLAGHARNAYWYGSQLSVEEARSLAPHNNATSLQVTASVMAGVIWAIENPSQGIVEPEEMDFRRILELAGPYLGKLVGVWSDWTPLDGRGRLFPEDLDPTDPWQFKNIRVV